MICRISAIFNDLLNRLCLAEISLSEYALSWPACTDKPLGPRFELRDSQPRRPCTL